MCFEHYNSEGGQILETTEWTANLYDRVTASDGNGKCRYCYRRGKCKI